MKNFLKTSIIACITITALILSSCEEVIDLNLNTTAPKMVIEAILTNADVAQVVTISYTKNFNSDNTPAPVTGANVSVTEESGPTITYPETTPGNYVSARFRGTPGKTYTITVFVNGVTYSAKSKMPVAVPIKSLDQIELTAFGETRKIVQVNYDDPAGVANFYYNRVFVNNVKRDNFYVESDRFTDGREVKNSIFLDEPDLKVGDKVKIELLTIDEQVYKYLFSITQITGNGGPPTTPANPASNFNNGALGFFSASTFAVDEIVIE